MLTDEELLDKMGSDAAENWWMVRRMCPHYEKESEKLTKERWRVLRLFALMQEFQMCMRVKLRVNSFTAHLDLAFRAFWLHSRSLSLSIISIGR